MEERGQRSGHVPGTQASHVRVDMCPVSTRPILGTSWSEVRTNTGHMYYYCQNSGTSTWEMPEEVKSVVAAPAGTKKRTVPPRVVDDRMLQAMKRAKAHGAVLAPEYEAMLSGNAKEIAGTTPKRRKKKKQEREEVVAEFDVTFDEDDIAEEEQNIERGELSERREQTEQEKKDVFFQLLSELGIHAFSRFEKELGRMQGDSRFVAVEDVSKRKSYFEEYCKGRTTVDPKKSHKRWDGNVSHDDVQGEDKRKRRIDAFNALLQEKVLKAALEWKDVVHVLEKDDRFGDIESERQRKDLFHRHMKRLEKAEMAKNLADRRMERDIQAGKERQLDSSRREARLKYKALLTEMVRHPEAQWESEMETLRSDAQGRWSCIDEKTAKEMFDEHLRELQDMCKKKLMDLYAKNAIPKNLSFEEAETHFEDEILDYSESLQRDAWTAYTADR